MTGPTVLPAAPAARVDRPTARAELVRALAAFAEPPGGHHDDLADALGLSRRVSRVEHTEAFVLESHPYASFHLSEEGVIGGEVATQVAGFWEVLGLDPPAEPDHLVALLGLYAALLDAEPATPGPTARKGSDRGAAREPGGRAAAIAARSRTALLWEHLLTWVPGFLDSVVSAAPAYAAWAVLLGEVLLEEASSSPMPRVLPAALRQGAHGLGEELGDPDSSSGTASVSGPDPVALLVAPLRCGMVLTPRALARGADELGLALRVGGRRFLVESLLAQDPASVLRWLAQEAERWATWHESRRRVLGPVASFWSKRATTTASWLAKASELPARR